MNISKTVIRLSVLIVILAGFAACMGLFYQHAGAAAAGTAVDGERTVFLTKHGEEVELFDRGLYRMETIFVGANFKGQDRTTLFIGIPGVLLLVVLYARGSVRGGLLLLGILGYFLYVYMSMALSSAYNELFLIYVALFSLSLFAFIILFRSFEPSELEEYCSNPMPRTGPAVFMIIAGIATLFIWGEPIIRSLLQGTVHERLNGYTTMVTEAIDLAIITPSTIISGVLILRRETLGYIIAFPLLGLILMLIPVITLGTISQLSAGVTFTPAEIAGPISGFGVLGLFGLWVIVALLRKIGQTNE